PIKDTHTHTHIYSHTHTHTHTHTLTHTHTHTHTHIIPVSKKSPITCLNNSGPVALTSIILKCFERLARTHICSSLPVTLDPLKCAYRPNRSTDDIIALTVHTALSHLDKGNTYV